MKFIFGIIIWFYLLNISYNGVHEDIAAINIELPGEENRKLRRQLIKHVLAVEKDRRINFVQKYAKDRKKARVKRIEERRRPIKYVWYFRRYTLYTSSYYRLSHYHYHNMNHCRGSYSYGERFHVSH